MKKKVKDVKKEEIIDPTKMNLFIGVENWGFRGEWIKNL